MRIPTATYRLQMGPDFGFRAVTDILDYLNALGISDIYASPIFRARPGSAHGYDVLDPNQLNPELGSPEDWRALTNRRRALGLGWLQDIVPNHMAYSGENNFMAELLEQGPGSGSGMIFDIEWDHPGPELKGRVSAPFLGKDLDACIRKGEIGLRYDAGGLYIEYFEHRFPLSFETYPVVFGCNGGEEATDRPAAPVAGWLQDVARLAQAGRAIRAHIDQLKNNLWSCFRRTPEVQRFVTDRLQEFNGPESSGRLKKLLDRQFFYLTFWKNADRTINYRRFFSINGLIALRQEDPGVFEQTHRLVVRFAQAGDFSGLRVDHVDGLLAPGSYLKRLRNACGDCYIVVEKITAADEGLPPNWPVQGCTGYEFSAHVDRLFTFAESRQQMEEIYRTFCGSRENFESVCVKSKQEVLQGHFGGDLDNLAARFKALPEFSGDSISSLRKALAAILINMPVYRTYLSEAPSPDSKDIRVLSGAVSSALTHGEQNMETIRRIEKCLGSRAEPQTGTQPAAAGQDAFRKAVGAFEQLSVTLSAKGMEDTAFYRYPRMLAHNEVGADLQLYAETPKEFDCFAEERLRRSPFALNTLSTHDSKRCADVRARLLVLTEMPGEWSETVTNWQQMNHQHVITVNEGRMPDRPMEYYLYQTLVGTFPVDSHDLEAYRKRIEAHMIKASRESKMFTDWSDPDAAYENALKAFIRALFRRTKDNPFLFGIRSFACHLACFGNINTLSRTLIQLTTPGIPDIYQGTELMCDTLVDPDNRGPVDFERRRRELEWLATRGNDGPDFARSLIAENGHDRVKLYLVHTCLKLRKRFPDLFAHGSYLPLSFKGSRARHGFGFARRLNDQWSISAVPLFLSRIATPERLADLPGIWQDTQIALPENTPRKWRNLLTGACIQIKSEALGMKDLLSDFPVALLISED